MPTVIHAFRPKRTSIEDLEAIFVGREHLLQDMLIHLSRWKTGVSRQHYLLIGPRGIGKTNLLILLENRVNKSQDLRKKWHPISLPEDLYGVTKVSDLLVESLKILADKSNDHNVKSVYNRVQFDDNEPRVIDLSLDAFRKFHVSHQCGILMMVENVNRLLERDSWYESDIRLLRKILIEEDWLMMVCTSPTFLNAVTEPEEPLFEFFAVRVLSELTFDEQQRMLHKLASLSGNIDFQNYLKKFQSRLQALYHFTGGNPRLTIMLYDLVANQNIIEVKTELDLLLDKLTPFYQDRMKDIPTEQGRLLEAMALLPEGCTPTELAKKTRTPAKSVRALIARLEKAGYVRKEERRLKRTVYILPERFFRIWHQMNHSRAARGRVQYLLEFFSSWYSSKEERDQIWNELMNKFQEGFLEGDESRTEDVAEYMEYIAAISEGSEQFERIFDRIRSIAGVSGDYSIVEELNRFDEEYQKNGDYFVHKGYFLANELGWHDEAYGSFKRAIELKRHDIIASFNIAVALDKMGKEDAAKRAYLDTASFLFESKIAGGIERVEDVLIKILQKDTDYRIVRTTAYILGRTAKKDIVEKIINIIQKAELSWRRQHCATALGLLRAPVAVAPLIQSLGDESNNVRGSAATALGRIGSEQAVAPLIECLKDEANDVRGSAATALGRIGSEQAVMPLIECLKDEANDVRGSAATALGRIGSEQAVMPLIACLKDEANNVRGSTATALGQIGSEQAAIPLIACLKDEANNVRGSAATALGRIGSEQAVMPLIECLRDETSNVRGSAATALGQIGSEETVEPLIEALKDKVEHVRFRVVAALGRISSEKQIPNLLDVINVLGDLIDEELIKKDEASLRQVLHSAFRMGDLKIVQKSIEIVKSKLDNSDEFCAPYLIALEYLESNRNPAVIERQHLEMREAVLLLVDAFDEGYSKE